MSSEEGSEKKALKRITIKTESRTRWFENSADFLSWTEDQLDKLNFIKGNVLGAHNERRVYQSIEQRWVELRNFASRDVVAYEDYPDEYEDKVSLLASMFEGMLGNKEIFTEDAPFYELVYELASEGDYVSAVVCVAYFLDFELASFNISSAVGLQKAFDWERGLLGRIEAEENSLKSLRNSWDAEFRRKSEQINVLKDRIDTLGKRAVTQLQVQKSSFENDIESFKEKLEASLDKGRQELAALTEAYDEKLALQAPVRYWGMQEKFHRRQMIIYAIATGVATLCVITGLALIATFLLNQPIGELIVGRLITMGVLTTFAIWIVKILANIFMSHNHLHADAQERRTMIHTYLALLRQQKGLQEDERQLILQTLFRPSATGMIKEDPGPSHLVDLMNRMTPRS